MANIAFRLLLTFNATSLLVIIFLAKEGCTLGSFLPNYVFLNEIPAAISYVAYVFVPLGLTGISLLLSKNLGQDEFKAGEIDSIELANNSFLPSYLGYFFVALSINNWDVLQFVYLIVFVFTFLSQALYFNPLFLFFGYEFYNIKTQAGTGLFLISRHDYRKPSDVEISIAYRINNYTFIER